MLKLIHFKNIYVTESASWNYAFQTEAASERSDIPCTHNNIQKSPRF